MEIPDDCTGAATTLAGGRSTAYRRRRARIHRKRDRRARKHKELKMTKNVPSFIVLAIVALAVPCAAYAADASNKTLQDLQSAYNGESNAHAKYLEFAKTADSEGYSKVASLFRAAAAAEQIHLTCEGAVIKEMGAIPQADIKPATVKSTKQNLEDSASKGEAYERDTMYPQFIRQAHKDGNKEAAQCFDWARAAEAEHFRLFTAAVRDLDRMKGGPETYYVCSEGGYTMAKLNAARCPGGKYEEVK
jgi:rubrerythrin